MLYASWTCASEELTHFTMTDGVFGVRERAVRLHLAPGAKESAERGATERATDTHALHAQCRELAEAELRTLKSHDDVDRPIDGANQRGNFFFNVEDERSRTAGSADKVLAADTRL
jgi:hypothetical protein